MSHRRANVGRRTSKRRKKRKASMRQCDAAFSKLVRSVGYCEIKEQWPHECSGPLQCMHKISRRYRAVRWDRDNAMAGCAYSHLFFTHRPLEWERYLLDTMGPDALESLKRRALRVERVDFDSVLMRLREAA